MNQVISLDNKRATIPLYNSLNSEKESLFRLSLESASIASDLLSLTRKMLRIAIIYGGENLRTSADVLGKIDAAGGVIISTMLLTLNVDDLIKACKGKDVEKKIIASSELVSGIAAFTGSILLGISETSNSISGGQGVANAVAPAITPLFLVASGLSLLMKLYKLICHILERLKLRNLPEDQSKIDSLERIKERLVKEIDTLKGKLKDHDSGIEVDKDASIDIKELDKALGLIVEEWAGNHSLKLSDDQKNLIKPIYFSNHAEKQDQIKRILKAENTKKLLVDLVSLTISIIGLIVILSAIFNPTSGIIIISCSLFAGFLGLALDVMFSKQLQKKIRKIYASNVENNAPTTA